VTRYLVVADERAAPDTGGAADESVAYFVAHETEIEQRDRHWARRTLPRAVLIGLLIVTLWLVPSAVSAYRAQQQSDRVQSHGVRTNGYVRAIHNDTHSYLSGGRWGGFRRSSWSRSMITVQLPQNADTTVYSPQRSTLSAGAQITVLLDPDDPSYAELPGQPLERGNGWVVVVIMAAMVVAADIVIVALLIRAVTRRRPQR